MGKSLIVLFNPDVMTHFYSKLSRALSPDHTAHDNDNDNDTKKNRSPIKFMLAVTLLRYVAVWPVAPPKGGGEGVGGRSPPQMFFRV